MERSDGYGFTDMFLPVVYGTERSEVRKKSIIVFSEVSVLLRNDDTTMNGVRCVVALAH